jgi:NADH-quinone oxidoreductase subunit A
MAQIAEIEPLFGVEGDARDAWRSCLTGNAELSQTRLSNSSQLREREARPKKVGRSWHPGRAMPIAAREAMMTTLIVDYLPIAIFIGVAAAIGLALLIAPFLVAYRAPDVEKLSAYECGFNPFDDARMKFDVRFYLVAILFIIFDLEVAFLFPWAITFGELGWHGFWSMMIFLGVLAVGYVYEWRKGALEWD